MTKDLETICAWKIRVHRKAVLTEDELKCKERCSGFNDGCSEYKPIVISAEHYLVKKNTYTGDLK